MLEARSAFQKRISTRRDARASRLIKKGSGASSNPEYGRLLLPGGRSGRTVRYQNGGTPGDCIQQDGEADPEEQLREKRRLEKPLKQRHGSEERHINNSRHTDRRYKAVCRSDCQEGSGQSSPAREKSQRLRICRRRPEGRYGGRWGQRRCALAQADAGMAIGAAGLRCGAACTT